MSNRRPEQKGVEAIFTPPKRIRTPRILIGIIGILAGIVLWTTVILSTDHSSPIHMYIVANYLPLTLTSIGTLLAVCGAGICIVTWTNHHSTASSQARLNIRLSLIVFLQSLLLVALYASLVQEYQSNLTMQLWVRSVFTLGDYLLNGSVVIAGSFILGVLVVLSLTRESFAV